MKKNSRLEARRKKISKDVDIFVQHSFDVVDRIFEILKKQGKEQKDLAKALGKSESEISKWMTGSHNFTIKTISKIEAVLGESVITTKIQKDEPTYLFIDSALYSLKPSDNNTISISHKTKPTFGNSSTLILNA